VEGRLVGLHRSDRPAGRKAATTLVLTAATPLVGNLWIGTWVAALAVGVLVWGLILWSAFVYRRRDVSLPPQTRYNLPIEFLYTIAPFTIIAALFFFTVQNQDELLEVSEDPDVTIGVVGQQWAWTFNYLDDDVYDTGTTTDPTTLYLPVNQTVRFELQSPDVIHSFWVPSFYMKMDVIPGKTNTFQATPNREGRFAGKCAELCGVYHSRMLFNVEIVSQNEYEEHLDTLRDLGQTGEVDAPLRGSFSTEPLSQTGSDQ
jgi:cytochrome c oxidase subunit 2